MLHCRSSPRIFTATLLKFPQVTLITEFEEKTGSPKLADGSGQKTTSSSSRRDPRRGEITRQNLVRFERNQSEKNQEKSEKINKNQEK